MNEHNHIKDLLDVAAGATMLATLAKILPAVAAVFTIVWTGLRIYDWIMHKRQK